MLKTKYNQYLFGAVIALFIYMPFHVFLSQWLSTYTGGLEIWKVGKDFITALVTILFIVTVFARKKDSDLYHKILFLVGLYGLIHLILGFVTDQPKLTFGLAIIYNLRIFCYLIIGYSMVLIKPKSDLIYKYRRLLLILSTVICLLAILQWLLPKDILTHFGYSVGRGVKPNFFIDDKPDLPRAFSTLRDPNSLGAFLILPIVFLAQSLILNWRNSKKTLILGLLILHTWVLLLTFSRSTLLATVLAVVSLVILEKHRVARRYKKQIISSLLILLMIIPGFIFMFKDQYFVQNTVFHADESTHLESPNALRRDLAQKAVDGIVSRPLGHGPGTAGLVSTRMPGGLLTENYYLQILYEVGIFGFLVFISIFYLVIKNLWSNRIKNKTNNAVLASLLGLTFACLFFHTLSNEAVTMTFSLLIGMSLVSKMAKDKIVLK